MTLLSTVFAVMLGFFLCYVPVHFVLSRRESLQGQVRLNARLGFVFLVAIFLTTSLSAKWLGQTGWLEGPSDLALMFFAELLLALGYVLTLIFYSAMEGSMRIRICVEFARAKNQPMSKSKLFEKCEVAAATQRRFDKLLNGGHVREIEGIIRLTPKGRRIAAISERGRRLFNVHGEAI